MTRRVVVPGLAPSLSLAPSLTLAPAETIYAGGQITPHAIAMGIDVGGALLDVSTFVEFGEGITYNYGRETQFDDIQPGTFTFTLNNSDGRFTPDNPSSPLATKVMEGMPVCWQLGSRLVHGTVLEVAIPPDESTWHQLSVTCDDMLGTAGRHSITSFADASIEHAQGDLLWKLDEPDGSDSGAETYSDGLGAFTVHSSNPSSTTVAVTYGVTQAPGLPGTAVTVTAAAGETNWFGTRFGNTTPISSVSSPALTPSTPAPNAFWNLWVYPSSTINLAVTPAFAHGPGYSYSMQIQVTPQTVAVKGGTRAAAVYTMTSVQQLAPHYLEMLYKLVWQSTTSSWALFLYLFMDGTQVASTYWSDPVNGIRVPATAGSLAPIVVNVSVTNPAGAPQNLSGTVQRISHTVNGGGLEYTVLAATLEGRRNAVDTFASDLTTATYNGPLSSAPIGFPDVAGSSLLDVLNALVRTESGHLFTSTAGTLTACVETVQVRARDRPLTPKVTFDVTAEADGLPTFVRDISNVAAQLDVQGPDSTVTVTDPTVTGRYVTAGNSETVLYEGDEDLREWGQDRLYRGRNRAVRAQQFTVDAVTTPTDRSGDLLGLVPGDRIRLSNTPAARLGFASWDGWLIGGNESHTSNSNRFALTLAPVLPAPALADTALFASGGDVTLAAAVAGSDTSVTVQSTSGALMSSTVPYTIQLDSENLTVTAVTGSTLTVTRGVDGTGPAVHAAGTALEVIPTALYAY